MYLPEVAEGKAHCRASVVWQMGPPQLGPTEGRVGCARVVMGLWHLGRNPCTSVRVVPPQWWVGLRNSLGWGFEIAGVDAQKSDLLAVCPWPGCSPSLNLLHSLHKRHLSSCRVAGIGKTGTDK